MTYQYFRCGKCDTASPAGLWNTKTLPLCKSREAKRSFKKIQFSVGVKNRYYVCPYCGEHIVMTDVTPCHASELKPGDIKSIKSYDDGPIFIEAPPTPIRTDGPLIFTWAELSACISETHTLDIDLKGCNGWILPKEKGKSYYLSTHTFYGSEFMNSTRALQSCGFNVVLANWDEEGGE